MSKFRLDHKNQKRNDSRTITIHYLKTVPCPMKFKAFLLLPSRGNIEEQTPTIRRSQHKYNPSSIATPKLKFSLLARSFNTPESSTQACSNYGANTKTATSQKKLADLEWESNEVKREKQPATKWEASPSPHESLINQSSLHRGVNHSQPLDFNFTDLTEIMDDKF